MATEVLADRMVNWIRHYDFLAGGATDGFAGRYVASLAVQLRHLRRVARSPLAGARLLRVLKALIFADLAFVRDGGPYESGLAANLGRLRKFLPRYVLADGVVGAGFGKEAATDAGELEIQLAPDIGHGDGFLAEDQADRANG